MSNTKKITIAAAIVFALGTGIMMLLFLHSYQQANTAAMQTVPVLVANRNIPARVQLNASMFALQARPKSKVDPDVVSDPKALNGTLSLITIPVGSALTQSKMGAPENVGLAVRLRAGQRAVSISVDKVKDVSGLIEPGDRVDVLAQGPKIDNHVQPAVTILRGILVLAVGPALETASATPSPDEQNAATVTLALTPHQADTLMTADENALIRLALRSPTEPIRSEPTERIVYDSSNPPSLAPAPRLPQTPDSPVLAARGPSIVTTPSPTINGVTVIEGSTAAAH